MNYALSVEEYILALTLVGAEEAAFSIKEEIFADISEQELEARLDSATNGLLAKNLLLIDGEEEIVDHEFKTFLLSLLNTPRVVRCQIADGTSLITASAFCGDTYKIQQTFYQDRVFRFWDNVPIDQLGTYLHLTDRGESNSELLVSEPLFDGVIDSLLEGKMLSDEDKDLFPSDFLAALINKEGRLNTLFDYQFKSDKVTVTTQLYITDNGQSWSIEQDKDSIQIKSLSIDSLFKKGQPIK
ncbi:hypothetical protein SAMN05443252_102501 [Bacillus sp. OV322]|uniref:hypothetical protein n=1 Tax=Bacillus sp. OV322 TaxID=1882764 RepID=UPI0008F1BB2A|nr:hypothetical protein [Bacillus sp. OV322]SFC27292.1 hypothetical protein SAMN05443252_102501 [Bacillus sp. OV322]